MWWPRALSGVGLGAILAIGSLLTGCGPRVSEARLAFYPPREQGCALELSKADLGQMMADGPWELLGHVYVGVQAKADPFNEDYLSIVRGRACAMGGEAFGILMATTNEGRA